MPNIVDLITDDHRMVETLFARFNENKEGAVASVIFRAGCCNSNNDRVEGSGESGVTTLRPTHEG